MKTLTTLIATLATLIPHHAQAGTKHHAGHVKQIICKVFGPHCREAIRVASCETGGTFWPGARNGQYLGLFQMGGYARATYGHSHDAWGQARAAYRYFVASGRDWSPWTCKP